MARRMYRTMIEHHKEDVGSAGDFNSFLQLSKEVDKYQGYVDKVVIHYLLEDRAPEGGTDSPNLFSNLGFGLLFAATHAAALETVDGESGLLDPNDIINVRARHGTAGSVTLPIKRVIRENNADPDEKDGLIKLYLKTPDVVDDDHIIVRFYCEIYGRYVEGTGL